jgi:glyoxylase-like metal-dependent hydrolase (beta-lactamase superfamily II)
MRSSSIQLVTPEIAAVFCPGALSNSYAVASAEGAYLVDTGLDPSGEAMLAGLRAVGRGPNDLTSIFLTHWHNDHTAGAAALRELTGARVWYPEAERAHFSQQAVSGLRAWLAARTPELGPLGVLKGLLGSAPPRAVEADAYPADGEELAHGVVALHTPGHTPGHFSYWDPALRALFSGDALAVCRGQVSFMSRFLTDDLEAGLASLRRLMDLEAEVLCPGHRRALAVGVRAEFARMRDLLDGGGRWPLWS